MIRALSLIKINFSTIKSVDNWRASEASESLIGLNNGNRRYMLYVYIVRETSLSGAGFT